MSVVNSIIAKIRAIKVIYDNTSSGLASENVQDAIDELASGTTSGTDHHACWELINVAQSVTISDRKQMIVFNELTLDGDLVLDGHLVIL